MRSRLIQQDKGRVATRDQPLGDGPNVCRPQDAGRPAQGTHTQVARSNAGGSTVQGHAVPNTARPQAGDSSDARSDPEPRNLTPPIACCINKAEPTCTRQIMRVPKTYRTCTTANRKINRWTWAS
jgi:hypothetical protein